jgi:hypothetical protein
MHVIPYMWTIHVARTKNLQRCTWYCNYFIFSAVCTVFVENSLSRKQRWTKISYFLRTLQVHVGKKEKIFILCPVYNIYFSRQRESIISRTIFGTLTMVVEKQRTGSWTITLIRRECSEYKRKIIPSCKVFILLYQ